MKKRAAIYVRVSSIEQKKHGISVDTQIASLTDYCKEHDFEIVNIYNDAGFSGRKRYTRRPAIVQLIDDVKAKKIDIILFTKLDRWFRSLADYYEVQSILDANKVKWRAIWEDYETETSSGIFKVNIMLSINQAEADRTSERIKEVNAYRREQGQYLGRPPIGYKKVGNYIYKDEATQRAVEAFFHAYLTTFSVANAIRASTDAGYTIGREKIGRMIASDSYCGIAGEGICEPYLTIEQLNVIRKSFEGRKVRPTKQFRVYLFSGIIRCAHCGTLLGCHQSTANNTEYLSYVCNKRCNLDGCPGCSISETKLEKMLLKKIIETEGNKTIKATVTPKDRIEKKKAKKLIESRLQRLSELYEEGDISKKEYAKKRDALKSELSTIDFESVDPVPVLPDKWIDIYNQLDRSHKKAFWNTYLPSTGNLYYSKETGLYFAK